MAPFTASNVWRASVLVITLLIQGHSLLASQNESMKSDQEVCMYNCSASELQKFSCSGYTNNSYTPLESHPFCCPGYFKTESGRCQICKDSYFMPRLNNCSNCKECRDCDRKENNSIKEPCNPENNTICLKEPDPEPFSGRNCPTEGLPATTGPPEIQTTTTGPNYSNIPVADPLESNKKYKVGFWVVLPLFTILFLFVFSFCCCLFRLDEVDSPVNYRNATLAEVLTFLDDEADNPVNYRNATLAEVLTLLGYEVDSPVNYRNATWTVALTPLGQKMRKTIPCIDRGGDGGRAGAEGGTRGGGGGGAEDGGVGGGGGAVVRAAAGEARRNGQQDDATDETGNLLGTEGQHETDL